MTNNKKSQDDLIFTLHAQAVAAGKETYIDPGTGYEVFTEVLHKKRGYCCQSGCRHCPWKKNKQNSSDEK